MTEHHEAPSPTRHFAPLAIVLGIPLLFAAIFFFTTPVMLTSGGDQGIFKCGSPSSPNVEAENICKEPEGVQQNKAIYSGLSGVALVGLGAVWLLRGQQRDDDWDDERPRGRRRDDDIDLRRGDSEERTDRAGLRGAPRGRSDAEESAEGDSRASRRTSRRERAESADTRDETPSRRRDDDWASDGWR